MKSENCPEVRREIAEKSRRANRSNEVDAVEEKAAKSQPKLFAPCGRPYCLNAPKLDFTLQDEADRYELDLHVYKYTETFSLLIEHFNSPQISRHVAHPCRCTAKLHSRHHQGENFSNGPQR